MPSVAVVGALCRDRISYVSRGETYEQAGGGIYYAAHTLSTLGAKVLAVPLLAKQDAALLKSLQSPGIVVRPVWSVETTEFHLVYPTDSPDVRDSQRITEVRSVELSSQVLQEIERADMVHLASITPREFSPSVFSQCRQFLKGKISFDAQGLCRGKIPDAAKLLAGNIDILKVDENEAKLLASSTQEDKALSTFADWGISEILITKGSQGAILWSGGKREIILPVPPRTVVDVTGCGDTFIAAYLAQRLEGTKPVLAASFAAGMVSKKIEQKGALTRL